MNSMWKSLWTDECGYLVSAELALLGTVAGVGLVAGMSAAQDAMNQELDNVAGALKSLDQSYGTRGFKSSGRDGKLKSWTGASFYFDKEHEEKNAEFIETFSQEEGRYTELNRCLKPANPAVVAPVPAAPTVEVPPAIENLCPPGIPELHPQPALPRFESVPEVTHAFPVAPPVVQYEQTAPCPPSHAVQYAPVAPTYRIEPVPAAPVPSVVGPAMAPCAPWHQPVPQAYGYPYGYRPNSLPLNPLASPAGPTGLVW